MFPYKGFCTVKEGSSDGNAASPSTLTMYGLNIPASDRSSASMQSKIVLKFKANYAVNMRQAKLRGSDKNLWPSKQVQANRIIWDAVPAAEYEVLLFDGNDKLMWKSPDKFRVFGNANHRAPTPASELQGGRPAPGAPAKKATRGGGPFCSQKTDTCRLT